MAWLIDAVAKQTPEGPATSPAVVKDESDLDDAERDRRSRYYASAIRDEVARLDRKAAKQWSEGGHWDSTTYDVACTLREIGNTPGSGLTAAEAQQLVRDHAPTDSEWTADDVEDKIRSARRTVGDKGRTVPDAPVDPFEKATPSSAPTTAAGADLDTIAPEAHSGQVRMAYRLAAAYGDRLLYVRGIGWHHWTGTHFAEDEHGHASRAVLSVLSEALADSVGDKQLRADVAKCESASGIDGVLKIAATLDPFAATTKDTDVDPFQVNFTNGTLDLRTRELRPHDPADRITKIAAGAYVPDADRGVWHAFLAQILPDADERAYLQRVLGQALPGLVTQHLFPVLTGLGGNGKGTLYGLVEKALGDYATVIDPSLLMSDEKTGGPEMMQLLGVRLVFASETKEGRPMDEATMKRLTGGDKLSARNLYKSPVTWEPTHQLVYVTNHLPKVKGNDQAVWRRMRVVPFDVVIPEEERDDELPQRLEAHLEAVLAWLVEGYIDYKDSGMREPATVLAATAAYQQESDDVARFVEEECTYVKGGPPGNTTSELHSRWTVWATNSGARHQSDKAFTKDLKRLGYEPEKTRRGTAWWGLNLTVQTGGDEDS